MITRRKFTSTKMEIIRTNRVNRNFMKLMVSVEAYLPGGYRHDAAVKAVRDELLHVALDNFNEYVEKKPA